MTKYSMNIDLRQHHVLLKQQYNVDCCAPIACLHAIELLASIAGKRYNFSPLYVYYLARKMQGTENVQKCQLRSVFAALEKYGACSERLWPFDRRLVNTMPYDDAVFNGIQHKLQAYEVVENIDDYLQRNIPVIIGISIGELFIQSPCKYMPINGTTNKMIAGHAVLLVGSTTRGWILANSFGPRWGDKGYSILPYECSVDIGERYAITSFTGIHLEKNYHTFDK